MTLRARLALGFIAIAFLLMIPLGTSWQALGEVRAKTERLEDDNIAAVKLLGEAILGLARVRGNVQVYTILEDSIANPPLQQSLDSLLRITDSLGAIHPDDEGTLRGVRNAVDSVRATLPELRALVDSGEGVQADALADSRVHTALDRAQASLTKVEDALRKRSAALAGEVSSEVSRAQEVTMSAFGLSLALAGLIAITIVRSISEPVRELDVGMQAVADGDFRRPLRIMSHRDDEFGRLAVSYQEMTKRLAELDKLKAEFVSIASHELKTPINVILGYLQLLDEGLYGPLTPRQHEVIGTLGAQGQALSRLVQQLLDISRFEAGGGRLDLREVDVERFVSELEAAFHVLALQRDIRFHLLTGEGLPELVQWDADRMNEVLGNLLSNAFKFTERGGRVDLEVTRIADGIRFLVRDTGAGIAPAQLPHVFRKFYQADNQASASLKGTGLGLAIAKEIVEAHGGRISVDSTPGVGTTFLIELPSHAQQRRHGVAPARTASAGAAS